ncbi:MAG: ribosome silencing factor, partial [Gammaproteobacteria bacterium]|nr:ribosome silencing factor [Gammaproteobacteria bacterium]
MTSRRSPRPRHSDAARGPRPGRVKTSAPSRSKSRSTPAAAPRPAKAPRSAELVALEKLALRALEDLKAVNIRVLDVRGLTDVADTMIVASGTSDRHVRAIAESVVVKAKAAGRRPMGTEGRQDGEWVLIDLQDVLVHVMLPRVREFYALEQLWELSGIPQRFEASLRIGPLPREPELDVKVLLYRAAQEAV